MERPSIVQPLLPCTPTTLAVPQCTHPEIIFCRSPKVQVHSTSICTRMTIQRKTTLICLLVQPWLLVALQRANAILLLRPYCHLNVSFIFENHTKSLIYSLQFECTKVPFKNAKNGPFWRIFEQPEAYCQVVLPDKNWRKMLKLELSNETFWVICEH